MTIPLLTKIEIQSGEIFVGIIDFVTQKKLFFFNIDDDDHLLLAIMWSGDTERLTRFSVFCATNFPHIILPKAKLITIGDIKTSTTPITPTPKIKIKKRKIKFVNLSTK